MRSKSFCLEASAHGGLTTFDMPFSSSTTPLIRWRVSAVVRGGVHHGRHRGVSVGSGEIVEVEPLICCMALMFIGGVGLAIWLFFK